jgi:hypothetical protein
MKQDTIRVRVVLMGGHIFLFEGASATAKNIISGAIGFRKFMEACTREMRRELTAGWDRAASYHLTPNRAEKLFTL